jgi:ABC-type polysaccharide/polyol phosphate transport system ATPase subunit
MSDQETIIRLDNVSKLFPVGIRQRSLLRTLTTRLLGRGAAGESFAALRSVDFEVRRGDWIGLIGNNGAGKSTLLRVIAGVHPPSSGTVEVSGQRTLLAGLGVGMIDELDVERNIFLYGAMHGILREEMKHKLQEILEWAELSDFRHATLKNLSTGMRSRLAFSVTRYFKADIYLLDEALTAGDREFRKKCDEAMETYWRRDRTMVVASHDLGFVNRHCNKVLWLHHGRRVGFGRTADVLPLYEKRQAETCPN